MLGLGDIVVPGTFISLALRYDYFRYARAQPTGTSMKPYFTASLFAYVAGLAITMTVMQLFQAAQPALLYLRYAIFSLCACCTGAHEIMEIALLVSSPLYIPPGAAGSSSKPGDGLMAPILRPKVGVWCTNRVAIPRAERPPIPRTPPVCEMERFNGNYELGDCSIPRTAVSPSARCPRIGLYSYIIVVVSSQQPHVL